MRILITDALQRKNLAALRSLGRAGNQVFVSEYTGANASRYSKYLHQFIRSPNPWKEPEGYLKWLMQTIEQYEIEALLPMDDATMALVVSHQEALKKLTKLLVPSLANYQTASDKGEALEMAKDCGAHCPLTYAPTCLGDFETWKDDMVFPLILKPRRRSGSRGIRKVESWEALVKAYQMTVTNGDERPIVQAYIEQGTRYDVCLLYDEESQLRASFVQRELRQFPEPMGPSTVQESIKEDQLLEVSKKIMEKFQWKGVAELEFMESPVDGKYYFMEINTRFWASLQCSISAGVDFPLLVLKALEGQVVSVHDYEIGVKCRWLFPGDLLRKIFVGNKGLWVPSFWAGRKQGIIDDIYDPEDPFPLLGVGLSMLRFLFDVEMWKALIWR